MVDSGAAESVALPSLAPWVPTVESAGSKRGQMYLSASGNKLPNLGEKVMDVLTEDGAPARATYQVANVIRAPGAVFLSCVTKAMPSCSRRAGVYHGSIRFGYALSAREHLLVGYVCAGA